MRMSTVKQDIHPHLSSLVLEQLCFFMFQNIGQPMKQWGGIVILCYPETVLLLCLLFSSLNLALWFPCNLARRFIPVSFLICRVPRVLKDILGSLDHRVLQELQWVWTCYFNLRFSQKRMELHKYKYLTLPEWFEV